MNHTNEFSPSSRVDGHAHAALLLPSAAMTELAPQLVTIALAQAAILATQRALEGAHPILEHTKRPGERCELADAEHLAALILQTSDELAELLDDYAGSFEAES